MEKVVVDREKIFPFFSVCLVFGSGLSSITNASMLTFCGD